MQTSNVLRGNIYDRYGATLATTKKASTIAIAPLELYDVEQTAEILSQYMPLTPQEIIKAVYERKNYRYFYLKRQLDNFAADQIFSP